MIHVDLDVWVTCGRSIFKTTCKALHPYVEKLTSICLHLDLKGNQKENLQLSGGDPHYSDPFNCLEGYLEIKIGRWLLQSPQSKK